MTDKKSKAKTIPICAICGGQRVKIRGRNPRRKRIVCPTCLAERMDEIRGVSGMDYGAADRRAGGIRE